MKTESATLPLKIRSLSRTDRVWAANFLSEYWGGDFIVSRGQKHVPADCDGLIADDNGTPVGLLTYRVQGPEMEILTLNSLAPGKGIGTILINRLLPLARVLRLTRIWLVTNNDNVDAMRFFQRRGFEMKAIHIGAATDARKLKPSIPEIGAFGIPVRHEIELEHLLKP